MERPFSPCFSPPTSRYTGQSELIVGATAAQRNRPELHNLVGYLLNTLPIRSRIEGKETFLEFLDRVHGDCRDAIAHQDIRYQHLVARLNPARRSSNCRDSTRFHCRQPARSTASRCPNPISVRWSSINTSKEILARLEVTTDIAALSGCNFVIENVTEDTSIKRKVYAELNRHCLPECINLALSNGSSSWLMIRRVSYPIVF